MRINDSEPDWPTPLTDQLDDDQLRELQPQQFPDLLCAIQRTRSQLDAYEARVVAAAVEVGTAPASGDTDIAETVRRATGMSRRSARRLRRRSGALARRPDLVEALGEARITTEQAEVLARAKVPDEVHADLLAGALHEGSDDTRTRVQAAEKEADRRTPDQRFRHQHDAREVQTWTDGDGMWNLKARLDPEAGARVQAQLDTHAGRLWRDDKTVSASQRRTPGQRSADALVALICTSGSSSAEDQTATVASPHSRVHVTIPMAALRGESDAEGATVSGAELAASSVRRMACDAGIIPVVLGGPSQVLDFGRERRTVSPSQRAALVVRDGGCVWPGCHATASRCDAHHLHHWVDGGSTDLDNLALLCHRHHHFLHEGGMTLSCDHSAHDSSWVITSRVGRELHRSPASPIRDRASDSPPGPLASIA